MDNKVNILCLETSSLICSVALISDGRITKVRAELIQNHAEVLMQLIDACLEKGGVSIRELNAIALSDGPGSYTGLRIGSSTAKGICFALGIPLLQISTLKAIASSAIEESDADWIWPMIDARRMEVYHCIFDRNLTPITEVRAGIIGEADFMPDIDTKRLVLCGDGAMKAKDILNIETLDITPDASFLCKLALSSYMKGDFASLATYEPFYLKSANITTSLKKSL